MTFKLTTAAAAIAAMGFAGTAMAQQSTILNPDPAVMDIDVVVQEIALLEVIKSDGQMVIDDNSDNTMGNPTSALGTPTGGPVNSDPSVYAQMRLSSNFDVESITVNFPRTNNIRRREDAAWPANTATFNGTGFDWFGVAEGAATTNTLGVFPQAIPFDGTTVTAANIFYHDFAGNGPITITGPASGDIPAGIQLYALGVSTNWTRTLVGEPVLALADTYSIQLEATITP